VSVYLKDGFSFVHEDVLTTTCENLERFRDRSEGDESKGRVFSFPDVMHSVFGAYAGACYAMCFHQGHLEQMHRLVGRYNLVDLIEIAKLARTLANSVVLDLCITNIEYALNELANDFFDPQFDPAYTLHLFKEGYLALKSDKPFAHDNPSIAKYLTTTVRRTCPVHLWNTVHVSLPPQFVLDVSSLWLSENVGPGDADVVLNY
jgi:hypothetical protein